MATKMVMPLLGQTMEEGTVIKWFKEEGDEVKEGEPLLEVMTDKVNMEVEASESGVLRKILAPADAIVPVKDPIAIIGSSDENIDDLLADDSAGVEKEDEPAPSEEKSESSASSGDVISVGPDAESGEMDSGSRESVTPQAASGGRVFSSPAARRLAKEKGIDISELAGRGTGPNGRVVENDVENYAASAPKATPLADKMARDQGVDVGQVSGTGVGGKVTSDDIEKSGKQIPAMPVSPAQIGGTVPFAGLRKAVAQNVSASAQQAPHVTLVSEVDATELVAFRKQTVDDIEEKYGVRISFTDIIIKAAARAILDFPLVNGSLQGDQIVISDRINVGVATAVENGLLVPVIKDVQSKSIPQISAELKQLAKRAREGSSQGDDFKGGTFSVTNLGSFGVDSFNPIITPGQSAILGVCRIVEKPVVHDGEIVARSMMNLCLSFDHRVIDGAPAAQYLARVRELLESPFLIFM